MKNQFSIDSAQLKELLKQAVLVTPSKAILADLENIEIAADKGILSVRSTDGELSYFAKLEIENKSCSGKALTQGRRISAIIDSISGILNITFTKTGISIESDGSKYNLPSQVGELPNYSQEFKPVVSFEIPSDVFQRMISDTVFAIAPAKLNTALSGLCVDVSGKLLRMYGSDGRKLAKTTYSVKSREGQAILPPKVCALLTKAFSDEPLSVSYDETQIKVEGKNVVVFSRLIDATMPMFESVIEKITPEIEIEVPNQKLTQTIKRIIALKGDSEYVTEAVFTLSDGNLTITANDTDKGSDGTEVVPVEYKGAEYSIKLNAKNIYDLISHIQTPNIFLHFNGTNPVVMLPDTTGDVTFFSLSMPIK